MRLSAEGLKKSYGRVKSLDDVAVDFTPAQIHAVLGENGAGKSTLMKVLFGLVRADAGRVFADGRAVEFTSPHDAIALGLGMVQQHFTLVDTASVVDNIMVGHEICRGPLATLDREAAEKRLDALVAGGALALPWRKKVGELSVGQKQKVEILKLLFRDARVLFLDEPTAVLAPDECVEFFAILKRLKAEGRTIVLITHRISEVLENCDTYTILRQGRRVAAAETAGQSAESLVEAMIGRGLEALPETRPPARAEVVSAFNNFTAPGLVEVNMHVQAGEIVGIAGVEGSGQAELVRALLALNKAESGEARFLDHDLSRLRTAKVRALGLGLIPEDRLHEALWLEESCHRNLAVGLEKRFSRGGWIHRAPLKTATAEWARAFDVRAGSLDVPVKSLSGGNQQKLVYAREVAGRRPKFLVAHQPSRGVDLGAMDLIHRRLLGLRADGLAILILSSDLDELFKLCDRLYVLYSGRVAGEFARESFDRMRVGAAMTGAKT